MQVNFGIKDKNWMLIVRDDSLIVRKWGAYDLSTVLRSDLLDIVDGG